SCALSSAASPKVRANRAIWDSTLRRDRHSHTHIIRVARISPQQPQRISAIVWMCMNGTVTMSYIRGYCLSGTTARRSRQGSVIVGWAPRQVEGSRDSQGAEIGYRHFSASNLRVFDQQI